MSYKRNTIIGLVFTNIAAINCSLSQDDNAINSAAESSPHKATHQISTVHFLDNPEGQHDHLEVFCDVTQDLPNYTIHEIDISQEKLANSIEQLSTHNEFTWKSNDGASETIINCKTRNSGKPFLPFLSELEPNGSDHTPSNGQGTNEAETKKPRFGSEENPPKKVRIPPVDMPMASYDPYAETSKFEI